ncbi:uncharacterized protein LOC126885066 isoform X1 [Diabrotica virgifera virgifera]|uniref:Uncharacterized protein n=2 Tax=Diabrotica virgifera virgifera TaxID=50390 RepID=A0ABM5KB85_DIAVI|nr:uncharacterized protein LOC126885066 isoform X1 [Diabrotica virgifera virgifera]
MKNGLSKSGADNLQVTYDKMNSCISGVRLFETPMNELISKIEDCSRDAIKESKACLAKNQTYFPEYFLSYAKSNVKYMYDDKDLLSDSEIISCLNNVWRYTVKIEYDRCLTTVYQKTGISGNIPDSRQEFCRYYVSAAQCYPDTIKPYCSSTANISKFFSDYINTVKSACQD